MRQQSVPAVGTATVQVVLDRSQVAGQGGNPPVGSTLSVTGAPGAPALVVVGYANSITNIADGWVAPARSPACGGRAHQPARAPGSRCSGIQTGASVP